MRFLQIDDNAWRVAKATGIPVDRTPPKEHQESLASRD